MRAYHLVPIEYGLQNLKEGHLKVAEFADLNDPFELLSIELSNKAVRRRFLKWRTKAISQIGILCFSRRWTNPVLWSHYAYKHTGLCLGFDVPDSLVQGVTYLKQRSPLDGRVPATEWEGEKGTLLHAKFEHWTYEDEVRRVVRLKDAIKKDGRYFWPFGNDLVLREVVAGALCNVNDDQLKQLLGQRAKSVTITKARLGFKKFEVVMQQRGFRNTRRLAVEGNGKNATGTVR